MMRLLHPDKSELAMTFKDRVGNKKRERSLFQNMW